MLSSTEKNNINIGFKGSISLKEAIDFVCEEQNCTSGYLIRESLYEYFKKRGYIKSPDGSFYVTNHYRRKKRQTEEEKEQDRENLRMLKTMVNIAVAYTNKHPDI